MVVGDGKVEAQWQLTRSTTRTCPGHPVRKLPRRAPSVVKVSPGQTTSVTTMIRTESLVLYFYFCSQTLWQKEVGASLFAVEFGLGCCLVTLLQRTAEVLSCVLVVV